MIIRIMNQFYKINAEVVDFDEFLEFWERVYDEFNFDIRDSEYYDNNIQIEKGKLHNLDANNIRQLFYWKNGKKLSKRKEIIVEKVVEKLKDINDFRLKNKVNWDDYEQFYTNIVLKCTQGIIWGPFIVHISNPLLFPIIDQHVVRAQYFIIGGKVIDNIPKSKKISQIYRDYKEFFNSLEKKTEKSRRIIDKALWAFGKCLKGFKFLFE